MNPGGGISPAPAGSERESGDFIGVELQLRAEIDERFRFERLVADLAARFASIGPGELDEAVVDSQRQVVEALDLDRSALLELADGDDLVYTRHHWSRPDFPPPPTRISARESFPWLFSQVRAGETTQVVCVDDVPDPIDRRSLRQIGTKSTVCVPLVVGGQFIGVLTFASLREERHCPPQILDRLRLLGAVFAQALARCRGHQALQDALTEVERLRDQLARDNLVLLDEVKSLRSLDRILGIAAESDAARRALKEVEQVASTSATVLLLGETGSGKGVFAQAIHDASPRHKRPMVRVNCAAIPTALIESELFGRERGAYTGALSRQIGRFELANGSTIFLDEIGDLPLEAQIKLLRVIDERVVERLGSVQPIKVDVRLIAATNRNLEEAVAARTFREDLYYRLNVYPITVPPLRERVKDIPALVWSFVEEFSGAFGKPVQSISKESLLSLQRYSWPGNVRELRNVIERAMIVATGPHLVIDPPGSISLSRQKSLKIADVEADHIRTVLDRTGWRVRGPGGAADLLGMKPTTLEGRMARLGIHRSDKRS